MVNIALRANATCIGSRQRRDFAQERYEVDVDTLLFSLYVGRMYQKLTA